MEDFNIGYGHLGHMMYSMFMQKEKNAPPPPVVHTMPALHKEKNAPPPPVVHTMPAVHTPRAVNQVILISHLVF